MSRSNASRWCVGLLAAALAAGCSGILLEKEYEDGRLERVRIGGGESWKLYDRNPLKQDSGALILKKETTF